MSTATDSLATNLAAVRSRIAAAAARSPRSAPATALLAVTKSVGPEVARSLLGLGVLDLGENRVAELETKASALGSGPRWHMVGTLQRNKAKRAVAVADLVHSLDSLPLLETLDRLGAGRGAPVRALVEVNAGGETTKRGFAPGEVEAILRAARGREGVLVEGLMTLAPADADRESARSVFRALADLRDAAQSEGLLPPGAALSMGMSGDFEVAVEEGSTIVRIGSALFRGLDEAR
ncbi:MAG TPA: YggS family pyridoxal phosphate-dependent enzyme [Planctomycetota bacterium]|nr:YggS family pyridoxal phosphate-dependent enzyme [Planctomycetota bacterium]